MPTIKPGKYRHFKGKEYEVLGTAKLAEGSFPKQPFSKRLAKIVFPKAFLHQQKRLSETMEELVVYLALYGNRELWIRPKEMFLETVELNGKRVPRFEFIE